MPEKIILDCDPGHDDAVAIMLAAGNPNIDLLAITTCAGNQTLEKVTRNALAVAAAAGIKGVPIAAGARGPLVIKQIIAPEIHGETGLDGPYLPPAQQELDPRHGVDVIIDIVMSHEPGTVNLVPVGPLTNIALAMRKEPRIVERVKRVVLMGGSYTRGNKTPAAEFNIAADPEAAYAVFDAPWDVTMVGLDLTHQALATPDVIARIDAIGGTLSKFTVDMLNFFASTYKEQQGFEAGPVHDPCAVAYLIDPTVFTTQDAFVTVELTGTYTRGMTVTDFDAETAGKEWSYGAPRNTHVAITLDHAKFWNLAIDAIATLAKGVK